MKVTLAQTNPAKAIAKELRDKKSSFSDPTVAQSASLWLDKSVTHLLAHPDSGWRNISTFWPPRCVEAFSECKGTIFFGAGVSLPAGFPSWSTLLTDYFQLDQSLVDDDDLKNDPLTMAELAGQAIGNEKLQQRLREVFGTFKQPTTGHHLLAKLGCRVYVTTNYDGLFEDAWKAAPRDDEQELFIATNDTHVEEAQDIIDGRIPGRTVLFKIHGCVRREDEHLILTRRDYRRHYRANVRFFNLIINLLRKRHTLFVGFSHRDPEVSRLVDDAIHQFENRANQAASFGTGMTPATSGSSAAADGEWPQLYSLQFDMRAHTPEIFAARGIVALTPPSILTDPKMGGGVGGENEGNAEAFRQLVTADAKLIRSHALGAAVGDLVLSKSLRLHEDPESRLDKQLAACVETLSRPLNEALDAMKQHNDAAIGLIDHAGTSDDWLEELQTRLASLASQGVFVANKEGQVIAGRVGHLLGARLAMIKEKGVQDRPYFQIANSYRDGFVSDLAPSIFNRNGTFFICQPLLKKIPNKSVNRFAGVIFSAAQVGQWRLPQELAEKAWARGWGFVLTDSNGVCLLPAFGEFSTTPSSWADATKYGGDPKAEKADANIGFPYQRLLGLSRRDQLVRHIAKSVVPVQQDDDVLQLSKDSKYYTVVSEIHRTRWKLALSMPMTS